MYIRLSCYGFTSSCSATPEPMSQVSNRSTYSAQGTYPVPFPKVFWRRLKIEHLNTRCPLVMLRLEFLSITRWSSCLTCTLIFGVVVGVLLGLFLARLLPQQQHEQQLMDNVAPANPATSPARRKQINGPLKVLVTGGAGFLGFHTCHKLKQLGHIPTALDDFQQNQHHLDFKQARAYNLSLAGVRLVPGDVCNMTLLHDLLDSFQFHVIIHLAGQPGASDSLRYPQRHVRDHVLCFTNILEVLRARMPLVTQLIYASSSSAGGGMNSSLPINSFGATKLAAEALANAYHHTYGIPVTGLRFFHVYGPWGRPDMVVLKFMRKMDRGALVEEYGDRKLLKRDFIYINDAVDGIMRAMQYYAENTVFNIGTGQVTTLDCLIQKLSTVLGKPAPKHLHLGQQPNEFLEVVADMRREKTFLQYRPTVTLESGLAQTYRWCRQFYSPQFHAQRELAKTFWQKLQSTQGQPQAQESFGWLGFNADKRSREVLPPHVDFTSRTVVCTTYFRTKSDPQRKERVPESWAYIERWYRSVQELGLNAIVFYDDLSEGFVTSNQTSKIRCSVPCFVQVNISRTGTLLDRLSTNDGRFVVYLNYFADKVHLYDYILMTDSSDLYFRKNPFAFMYENAQIDMFFGRDNGYIAKEASKWIYLNMQRCYSRLMGVNSPVYNAGCVGGRSHTVIEFLKLMQREFEHFGIRDPKAKLLQNCNMPAYNRVIHTLLNTNRHLKYHSGAPFTSPFGKFVDSDKYYIIHK
eukprot:m.205828 g.205828  ORF g.205828 m.205828 type:complete len:748 (-) comp26053_c1_seq26:162-2405(-)